MSKTYIEAFEKIKLAPTIYCGCGSDIYTRFPHECRIVEAALIKLGYYDDYITDSFQQDIKKSRALEIIKEKEVNVFIFLHSRDLETYNDIVEENRKLTQEEFDLLKEVLNK